MEDDILFEDMDENMNEHVNREAFDEKDDFFIDKDNNFESSSNIIEEETDQYDYSIRKPTHDVPIHTDETINEVQSKETAKKVSFGGSHRCCRCGCGGFIGAWNICKCGHSWDDHCFWS